MSVKMQQFLHRMQLIARFSKQSKSEHFNIVIVIVKDEIKAIIIVSL